MRFRGGRKPTDISVRLSHTAEDGYYLAESQPFDLMILDVMLPVHSGVEILDTLRKRGNKTPVIILSAMDSPEDRVRGLDAGADEVWVSF